MYVGTCTHLFDSCNFIGKIVIENSNKLFEDLPDIFSSDETGLNQKCVFYLPYLNFGFCFLYMLIQFLYDTAQALCCTNSCNPNVLKLKVVGTVNSITLDKFVNR